MTEPSIYTQIGGKDAINAAVDIFYEKILSDDRIKHFFENINMVQQRAHQKAFLTYVLGGNSGYDGRTLRESHKDLVENKGLNEGHFQAVAENLTSTLEELKVPQNLIDDIMNIVKTTKDDILNK